MKTKIFPRLFLFLSLITTVVLIFSSCVFIIIKDGASADTSTDSVIDTNTPNDTDNTDTGNTSTDTGNTNTGSTSTDTDDTSTGTSTDTDDPNAVYTASMLSDIPPHLVYNYKEVTIDGKRGYQLTGVKAEYLKYLNGELTLPSLIYDVPVIEIGQDLFRQRPFTSVIIPEGVLSIGMRSFEECDKLVNLELPQSLKYIGAKAFNNCKSIKFLTIPVNVVDIDQYAFRNTFMLKEVIVRANALNGFSDFDAIFSSAGSQSGGYTVKIANTVSYIPSKMFNANVNEIIFEGNSICRTIGKEAFRGANISALNLPESVTTIGYGAFRSTNIDVLRLYSNVEVIDQYAFYGCQNLKSVYINGMAESIGERAFASCPSLSTVTIGENVKYIGDKAFENANIKYLNIYATNLENLNENNNIFYSSTTSDASLIFGKDVARIPAYLFSQESESFLPRFESVSFNGNSCLEFGLYSLFDVKIGEIEIPSAVRSIGVLAFSGQNVDEITVNPSSTSYKMVNNALFTYDGKVLLQYFDRPNIDEYQIPEGTESIKSFAFASSDISNVTFPSTLKMISPASFAYSKITSVHLPASCEVLGDSAFMACSELNTVIIENGLEAIGVACFSECRKLNSVTLPATLTKIGAEAFYNCVALDSLVIPANVRSIGSHAFYADRKEFYLELENPLGWCAVRYSGDEILIIANVSLSYWDKPYEIGYALSGDYSSYSWLRTTDSNLQPIEPNTEIPEANE